MQIIAAKNCLSFYKNAQTIIVIDSFERFFLLKAVYFIPSNKNRLLTSFAKADVTLQSSYRG